jgi:hypothetical protein
MVLFGAVFGWGILSGGEKEKGSDESIGNN